MKKKKMTIGTIGHQDHGKTTLTHAMTLRSLAKDRKISLKEDIGMTKQGQDLLERIEKLRSK